MLKLIAFLFTGCWHNWDLKSTTNLIRHVSDGGGRAGVRYMYQCTKCGRPKKQDII